MKIEIKRQFLHILIGLLYLSILYFLSKELSFLVLLIIFVFGSFISFTHAHIKPIPFLQDVLAKVERDKEKHIPGRGALSFTLGIILASIIFYPEEKLILIGAVTALTFGDGFSALIGKWIGKYKTFGGKTMEGTIGGIIAATLALMFFFSFEIALATAIFAMLAEYIPVNDNYVIPIVSGLVLVFLI
tara:strand:- start:4614 stop:5177 length:564 start_codon:yes stop_codon:yes gene_type:complete